MNFRFDYKKEKRKATRGIVVSAIILALALSVGLSGYFFYLDAIAQARRSQQREEDFDPWEDSSSGTQNAYKVWNAIGLTEEFASDFKETYHYYFAFDTEWYPFIVKMKGELGEEYQPLIDYVYKEEADLPEPVIFRGVAIPIEQDIREFAIECMNIIYDEEILTDENFEDYLGVSLLDLSKKPIGQANFVIGKRMAIIALVMGALAVFFLWINIINRRDIDLAEQRKREAMRQAAMWQNNPDGYGSTGFGNFGGNSFQAQSMSEGMSAEATGDYGFRRTGQETGSYGGFQGSGQRAGDYGGFQGSGQRADDYGGFQGSGQRTDGYSGFQGNSQRAGDYGGFQGSGQRAGDYSRFQGSSQGAGGYYGYAGSAETGYLNTSGMRLVPVKKSNMFLGIIGAIGGSLVGVALWLLISMIGFVAGIAGFVMLKFSLKGYEKLSGRLDKKGAVISLLIAIGMVYFSNVLDYVITLCRAFFEWDASFETIRFVIGNFSSLMTETDSWGGFYLNLALGYALSAWSCHHLIGNIFKYKD